MEFQYENVWGWLLTHHRRKYVLPSGRQLSIPVCEIYAEDPHSSSGVPDSEMKHGCLKPSLLSVMKAFLDMKQVPLFPLFLQQSPEKFSKPDNRRETLKHHASCGRDSPICNLDL